MLRFVPILAAAMLTSQSMPVAASPVQPTGKWFVDYRPTACEAKRQFGDVALVVSPGPLGQSTRLMLELPGKAARARQYPARVDPGDGRGAEKATAILFPSAKTGMRRLYAVLPNALVARSMASGSIDISAGNAGTRIAVDYARAALALGSTSSLVKALDKCMADLKVQWRMVDGKLPAPAAASRSEGDVRGIFRYTDYPEDAIQAGQGGTANYLLMIGKDGSVMDCVVAQSSGIASLDAMGCQVIRERAKFKPAADANGKPTVDTYVTPPIRWMISG